MSEEQSLNSSDTAAAAPPFISRKDSKSVRWSVAAERALSMKENSIEEVEATNQATLEDAVVRQNTGIESTNRSTTILRRRSSQKLLEDINQSIPSI
jgi:hypothetical protein